MTPRDEPAVCLTERVKGVDSAYAVVRVDHDAPTDEERFTVRRIVWDEEAAEAEVRRLSELNSGKGCGYFWQYTRVDRRS